MRDALRSCTTAMVGLTAQLRSRIKTARKQGSVPVRLLDLLRRSATAEGRSILWTQITHRNAVHQTTAQTYEDRYPELFDLAALKAPEAERILSFGCSTGEELLALRRRFPKAEIVGAEINARSRRAAAQKAAGDVRIRLVGPDAIGGRFDAIFALAVLQREPAMIEETGMSDLSRHYPFARFDAAVTSLVDRLEAGGLLCVFHCHYRVEDSSAGGMLRPVPDSPLLVPPLFGPDGSILRGAKGRSMFRKRS